jgi:DNA-binding GntR family transcriptional regulator
MPERGDHWLAGATRQQPSEQETAPARAYAALRFEIIEGAIPPGTHITIDTIARKLELSQTPVREALQRLEAEGLVVYRPSRGYSTTPVLDLSSLRSLFEFRLLVEPWAARQAAVDSLRNPASSLDGELIQFEQSASDHRDVRQEMLVHDTRFHRLIMAASGNAVVTQAYAQTHCHLHVFRLYPVDADGSVTIGEHRRVWQAIRDRDPDRAEKLMAKHILASYTRSARAFDTASGGAELNAPGRLPMVDIG